jgi:hypothetical protein
MYETVKNLYKIKICLNFFETILSINLQFNLNQNCLENS